MEKVTLRVEVIIDGVIKRNLININVPEGQTKIQYLFDLRTKFKPKKYMMNVERKMFEIQTHNFDKNICCNCIKMTKCPKVMDDPKRRIEAYPMIKTGIIIKECDKEKNEQYKKALEEYNRKISDINETDIDNSILKALEDDGMSDINFTVYQCDDFIYEDITKERDVKKIRR